jgi:hypothetical protein
VSATSKRAVESITGGTLSDHAAALVESLNRLKAAAANVTELLHIAGMAGARGDTADDFRSALAIHNHLVQEFNVTVRTSAGCATYCTCAPNAAGAAEAALERQGDTPCGITVTPTDPDHQALTAAHRALRVAAPLDVALKDPSIGRALRSYARKHPVRRLPSTDFKSLAANDRD